MGRRDPLSGSAPGHQPAPKGALSVDHPGFANEPTRSGAAGFDRSMTHGGSVLLRLTASNRRMDA